MVAGVKTIYDFVLRKNAERSLIVSRRRGARCYCPYGAETKVCSDRCPHFIVESIHDGSVRLVLTCGNHMSRFVEVIDECRTREAV